MCATRLNDGPLVCTRTDPHNCGHVYQARECGQRQDHDTEARQDDQ